MANLSIKDVPEAWTEALRQRAARNHRSLQGELMAMVEVVVHEVQPAQPVRGAPDVINLTSVGNLNSVANPRNSGNSGQGNFTGKASVERVEEAVEKAADKFASTEVLKGAVVGYDNRGQPIVQRGWKSVDQVLATLRAKYPEQVDSGPNSLEIIRAERKARDEHLTRVR